MTMYATLEEAIDAAREECHIHKDSGFPAASLLLIVLTVPASPPALPVRHMTDRTLILPANHFRKIYTSYSFLLLSDPCRG